MKSPIIAVLLAFPLFAITQNFPSEWRILPDEHMIKIGGLTETGIYKHDEIKTIYLEFSDNDWFDELEDLYFEGGELAADMTVDGEVFEDVGVSFKGMTSFLWIEGEEKKSFNIKTDSFVEGQSWSGYNTFNLNNCFQDPTFMREFLYLRQIRNHIPAAKAAYVRLVINGESWGIYPSVQQMNNDYLEEWFLSNDGTNWRADAPSSTGMAEWGDGTAALNYLGSDTSDYQEYYTMKSFTVENPWDNLVNTCDILNNTDLADLPTELPAVLDVDRTLWFLACENAFGDDDSYIFKGKMDYYCYWEIETGRLVPLEYDGNSVLVEESEGWGAFYHVNNVNYPLLNKLLNVPQYRQRYLAHLRTIKSELMDPQSFEDLVNFYDAMIDAEVLADTKKLYSYSSYNSGQLFIQNKLADRVDILEANTEVNVEGAFIDDVEMISSGGTWVTPAPDEDVLITASVSGEENIASVWLYYSMELVGNFTSIQMFDDGIADNGVAGDEIYGAVLPGLDMGGLMKFYIESVEDNLAETRTYSPAGAEHHFYYYQVLPAWENNSAVVINEVMASNSTTAFDENDEYEDWIELYNKGEELIDLSDYHLTDNTAILDKWTIPSGTTLEPDSYLIIWCDEDSAQGPLHANFKLSSSGEQISLISPNSLIADQSTFIQLQTDHGYARVPNGTGDFIFQAPTFAANNNNAVAINEVSENIEISVYPNPAVKSVNIRFETKNSEDGVIRILDFTGKIVDEIAQDFSAGIHQVHIQLETIAPGTYFVQLIMEQSATTSKFVKVG